MYTSGRPTLWTKICLITRLQGEGAATLFSPTTFSHSVFKNPSSRWDVIKSLPMTATTVAVSMVVSIMTISHYDNSHSTTSERFNNNNNNNNS